MTPLALLSLLSLKTEFAGNIDADQMRNLADEGLIDRADFPHVTERGEAYLDMVLDTPLPVQQWVDPRGTEPEYLFRQVEWKPGEGIVKTVQPPHRETAQDDGVRIFKPDPDAKAAAYAATVPATPEGFTQHLGLNSKAPEGIIPDDQIEVWYRDGLPEKTYKSGKQRPISFRAGSINWQHRGGDDDVVGYRKIEAPAVTKIHIGNSEKAK